MSTGSERVLFDGGGYFDDAVPSPDGRWVLLSRMTTVAASSELLLVDTADRDGPFDHRPGGARRLGQPEVAGRLVGLLGLLRRAGRFFSVHRYDVAAGAWSEYLSEDGQNVFAWPAPDGDRLAVVSTVDGIDTLQHQGR